MQGPVAIILAAGHGKRMKSERAKVLHEVCGQPMIQYVVDAARKAGAKSLVVVVGYAGDQVRQALADEPDVRFAEQVEQLGTGDAVKAARPLLEGYSGPALVLVGDEPLLRPDPLKALLARQSEEHAACLMGTVELEDPTGFGRIIRDNAGRFLKIVEQRDCQPEEAAVREVNPSCYVFQLPLLWEVLDQLGTGNVQHEYYLTDAPEMLLSMGHKVLAERRLAPEDALGVNNRVHLSQAQAIMQKRILEQHMLDGVTVVDPLGTSIDSGVTIGPDTVIFPFSVISGGVTIGSNCRVGPFAHLRSGTTLEDGAEVGAFVEASRSQFGPGARARHLAYLGNARIGGGANIGAGAVTANYDGVNKS
ncbi:MAG TPA: NTP transferase domain-containing protein, partial [Isosphaeraceae bacterium]|nr:NTP transferase domain-containing protein [Isosphaeraceae bacterium]